MKRFSRLAGVELPNYDHLVFRPILVTNAMAGLTTTIVKGTCLLDGIITTRAGTTTYAWQLFDGTTAGGNLLFDGTLQPMGITALRLTIVTGLTIKITAGAVNALMTITVGVPSPA